MYTEYEIRQIPLSIAKSYRQVEEFLAANGLRIADDIDYYAGIYRIDDDTMLAGGGLSGNIIKCIAVGKDMREAGFSSRLISHLLSVAVNNGYTSVRVFTKPENKQLFESMSFLTIATSKDAILMESGEAELTKYTNYLASLSKDKHINRDDDIGVIVMNANPFTLGHLYLIETSAKQVDHLFVIVVKEDVSLFTNEERKAMIIAGCSHLKNVTVCDGSDYQISRTTFPTYFLKHIDDATDAQIELDLNIFCNHIAKALHATKRFVGSEPIDKLTARYNEVMHGMLPEYGIDVVEIPRKAQTNERPISASAVRGHLGTGHFSDAVRLVPRSTVPYLFSKLASMALRAELDATPKPGLIDKSDNGAHTDMNYTMMENSIATLQPFFTQLSSVGFCSDLPTIAEVRQIGIDAEKAMYERTGGINTHKGALFSLGITIVVASHLLYKSANHTITTSELHDGIKSYSSAYPKPKSTHGDDVKRRYPHVMDALSMCQSGYQLQFESWLPYFRQNKQYGNEGLLRTLLLIMSQIDDTNIYYRKDEVAAHEVKNDAIKLFNDFNIEAIKKLNQQYIEQNISPGGAADMLALTIFIDTITE